MKVLLSFALTVHLTHLSIFPHRTLYPAYVVPIELYLVMILCHFNCQPISVYYKN